MARETRASRAKASVSEVPEQPVKAKGPAKATDRKRKEPASKGEPTSKRTKLDPTPEVAEEDAEVKAPAKKAPAKAAKKTTATKGRSTRSTRNTVEPEPVGEAAEDIEVDQPEEQPVVEEPEPSKKKAAPKPKTPRAPRGGKKKQDSADIPDANNVEATEPQVEEIEKPRSGRGRGRKASTPALEEAVKPATVKRSTRKKGIEAAEPAVEEVRTEDAGPKRGRQKAKETTVEPEPITTEEVNSPSRTVEDAPEEVIQLKEAAPKRRIGRNSKQSTIEVEQTTVEETQTSASAVEEEGPPESVKATNRRGKRTAAVQQEPVTQKEELVKISTRSKRETTTRGAKASTPQPTSPTAEDETAKEEPSQESMPTEEHEEAEPVPAPKGRREAASKRTAKTPSKVASKVASTHRSGRSKVVTPEQRLQTEAEVEATQEAQVSVEAETNKIEATIEQTSYEPQLNTTRDAIASDKRKLEESIEESDPVEGTSKRTKREDSADVSDAKPAPAKRGRGKAARGGAVRGGARGGRKRAAKKESSPAVETSESVQGDNTQPETSAEARVQSPAPVALVALETPANTEDAMEGVETTVNTGDVPERADSSTLRPEEDYDEAKDAEMETEPVEGNRIAEKFSTPEAESVQEANIERKEKSATPEPESARASILTPGRDNVKVTQCSPVPAPQPEQTPAKIKAGPVPNSSPAPQLDDTIASELVKPITMATPAEEKDKSRDVSALQPTVVLEEEEEEPVVASEVTSAPEVKSDAVEQELVKEATPVPETTEPVQAAVEEVGPVTGLVAPVTEKDERVEDASSAIRGKSIIPGPESAGEDATVDTVISTLVEDAAEDIAAKGFDVEKPTVGETVIEEVLDETAIQQDEAENVDESLGAVQAGDVTAQTGADTSGDEEEFFSPRKRILSPDLLDGSIISSTRGEESTVIDETNVLEQQQEEEATSKSENESTGVDTTMEVTFTKEEREEISVKTITSTEIGEDGTAVTTTTSVDITAATERKEFTITETRSSAHDSIVLSEFDETTVMHGDDNDELRPIGSSTPLAPKRIAQLKHMSPVRNGDVSDSSFEISELQGGVSSREERHAFGIDSSSPQKEDEHSFNLDAAKAAETPRTPPHGSPNQSHLSTVSDISPLRGDLDETMYFGKSSVGTQNDSRYSPSLSSPPRAESELFSYSKAASNTKDNNDAGLDADVSNLDSSTLDSSMLSLDAADGAIRIPLDEITLPSQLSPTPSHHTIQPLGSSFTRSKSPSTSITSGSTAPPPAPVAPRRNAVRNAVRIPTRLASSMNTTNLPPPRRVPISTSSLNQQRRTTAELTSKTKKHTHLNSTKGRIAPITVETVHIDRPKSPSPTPEERAQQAAIDRRRRKRIEAERGVTLGAGDESDFSPGRDMSGRKIKFLPKLEKREVPKLPLGSKQPEKGILKPLRKRLDDFGNLEDSSDLVLSPPQPVTVLKVVYAEEEEEEEWEEDDTIEEAEVDEVVEEDSIVVTT